MALKTKGMAEMNKRFPNGDTKHFIFNETPLLSPYLYAIIAGPYKYK